MSTQSQYVSLGGGLDTESPVLSVPPGWLREAWNFEQDIDGGYSRIAGYDRFDGSPLPSDATYTTLSVSITGAVAPGDSISGSVSLATGEVLAVRDDEIDVYVLSGVFSSADTLIVSSVVVASVTNEPFVGNANAVLELASDVRRRGIQEVPGSGQIRGVMVLGSDVFAFRDDEPLLSKKLFKATPTGWALVTTPTLSPGGSLEYVAYNFGSGTKLYGCDGVNKAFQFDGTTYTAISTGMTVDAPTRIACHMNHLFLAYGNSVQHSAIGDPLTWSVVLGAGEINVGAEITNMKPQPGQAGSGAMAISTASSLFVLYGTSAADWSLITLQSDVGAKALSMQNIGVAFMLSELGVTIIGQSQEYGNFMHSMVSAKVRTWLKTYGKDITSSAVHHGKNQYRLYFGNRGLYITVRGREIAGIMPVYFPVNVVCVTSTKDDLFYFGTNTGFVYRGDVGRSFDGQDIASVLTFPFNSSGRVRQRKRYRRLLVEIDSKQPVEMTSSFGIDYDDVDIGHHEARVDQAGFAASNWDTVSWDSAAWDGGAKPVARIDLEGSGENVGVSISHSSRIDPPFSIRSMTLEFSIRRGER